MKLLPIGSIVKIKGIKVCIIGYASLTARDTTQCGYYAVPYPIGYINIKKMVFLSMDDEFEILAYGYATEDSEKLIDLLGTYFQSADVVTPDKVHLVVDAYKSMVRKAKQEVER